MVVPTDYVSFNLFCDFKSYFSERNFAVVPTLKKSIYKVQILTFFRIMGSYA
ncbi:hypothetical protein LEP1GSC074_3860 [Leptospira noguchii str. Hook]|nr:hypothetical protein LEP1GSC041_2020 [Leptospira noguchii str. 2006001870]EMI71582.1 hypothetical protein LEP1GSC072_1144 [Leptospira noguchii str. Bonito]EMO30435.1 hypothetical protein LEP1GSC170_0520 [Leptospira interrogans serovar Bataviae str. HAI135]EMS84567.1 hypothetical protein LEP1GSC074_3860 [Leptospira noguchii str. Hook]EMS89137.1 hypothetical protein LEP1GSC073_4228 [Leptospira noguchii str. Cascata]